jgi:xanthine dehydrogenase accessory factor
LKNIYIQLFNELKKNNTMAMATIVEAKGSTPQIPGASALFSSDRLYTGTVGGGGLEADAQRKAFQALQKKASLLYKFNLTADISSEEEAICGGEVTILIDARPEDHTEVFERISESLIRRQPGVLITFMGKHSEEKVSIKRRWIEIGENSNPEMPSLGSKFTEEIKKSLIENKPSLLELKEETLLFLEPIYPPKHLVIAGAGHIGQAVSHLGNLLDFEVTVIDDRPEFANKEKLPEADSIIVGDIGKTMQSIPKSFDTYIVIVTRGHKNDADALRPCINSEVTYIGMIGSARKIKLMREKFLQEGWATSAQWDRIYAPIGVQIQSKTVQEIAVSIAAQLVLVRHINFLKRFTN